MASYTMGEVRIDGDYPVSKLLELSMDVGANRHGTLTYGGLADEDDAKRYVGQGAEKRTVSVSLRDELEFCGYPQAITAENSDGHCYLRVTLVTSSQLTDIEPRSRFFQDVDYTYEDMLAEAFDDSGVGGIVAVRGQEWIGEPILQYRETDWAFTLRMAGRLGTAVFPDVASSEPQATLGMPKRQAFSETSGAPYFVRRGGSLLSYRMKGGGRYRLGDSVAMEGSVYAVMRKKLSYEGGEIQEAYTLGTEHEFAVPSHHNKRIAGLELEGTVLERHEQQMQVLLDIDSNRKECGKTWFYYAPATNNGMYSMPLEDEKVFLQWQGCVDSEILIVRPDRKNGSGMPDPGRRHFLTEHENHLMMVPGKVEFTNPIGHVKWLAGEGFDISTTDNMTLFAGADVNIRSKAQVRMYSPERIVAQKTDIKSSIDVVRNEIHIKALKDVNIKSAVKSHGRTTLPERGESFTINATTALKINAAIPQVINAKK